MYLVESDHHTISPVPVDLPRCVFSFEFGITVYGLQLCRSMITKNDSCVGVPTYFRSVNGDAVQ